MRKALGFASFLLVACGGDVRTSTGTPDRPGGGGSSAGGMSGSGGSDSATEAGAGGLVHSIPLPPPSVDCTATDVSDNCFSISGYFDGAPFDSSCSGRNVVGGRSVLCADEGTSYFFVVPNVQNGLGVRHDFAVKPSDGPVDMTQLQLAIAVTGSGNTVTIYPGAWTFDANFELMQVDATGTLLKTGEIRVYGHFSASWGEPRSDCVTACRSAIVHGTFSALIERTNP